MSEQGDAIVARARDSSVAVLDESDQSAHQRGGAWLDVETELLDFGREHPPDPVFVSFTQNVARVAAIDPMGAFCVGQLAHLLVVMNLFLRETIMLRRFAQRRY